LQAISNLEKEKEHALKELHDCEERDVILQYELSHLQMEEIENTRRLEQMGQENADLVNPETEKVTKSINALEEDVERTSKLYESEKKRREEISAHINEVRQQQITLEEEKSTKAAQLAKLQHDPERIRKQAAVVTKAVKNLDTELERLGIKLTRYKAELVAQAAKRKEVDDVGKDLGRKLDLHRKTIEQREREVDRIRKTLDYERQQHKQLLETKVELELSLKGESESLRHTMDELTRSNKEFDQLKRTIKKKQGIVDSSLALQPGLESQKSDVEAELATYKGESVLLKKQLKNLKQEVDVYIANFLTQEVIEKEKKTELEAQLKVIKDLEAQITKWHAEEHRQRKTIQILTAQREIKAREAAKAQVRTRGCIVWWWWW
jgi:chromosome segregation ATPase